MNNIFILVGPSASGKSTVEEKLIKAGICQRYVTDTTRAPRSGEVDGVHYNFVSVEDFHKRNHFNVIKISEDWLYGSPKEALKPGTDLIHSVINVQPAKELVEAIKESGVDLTPVVVFFDIDKDLRINLMKKRGESEESIQARLAREDTKEVLYNSGLKPDLVVTDINQALPLVRNLVRQKRNDLLCDYNRFLFTLTNYSTEECLDELKKLDIWKD